MGNDLTVEILECWDLLEEGALKGVTKSDVLSFANTNLYSRFGACELSMFRLSWKETESTFVGNNLEKEVIFSPWLLQISKDKI